MSETKYKINKTVPALFSGTLMFLLIGIGFLFYGYDFDYLNVELKKIIFEITEIYFFLFVAMTYIEVLVERNVFNVLKHNLLIQGYSYKKIYWIIGFLAFFLSPLVDNLTTALILSTVILTLTKDRDFLIIGALNIVVAANAGGVFSPFGDITTLMAWTSGKAGFFEFFWLFIPALSGWLVTSYILSLFLPDIVISEKKLHREQHKMIEFKPGAYTVIALGFFTITISVLAHQLFHMPAMWGMLFGLALLELLTYRLDREGKIEHYYIYKKMRKVQMDTLLFFFGILAAIGALGFLGYLSYITYFYQFMGEVPANIGMGFISGIFGNVAVMNGLLKTTIVMDLSGWLLLTLTVGIGGSLISFGSAAGIGVMGKMKGIYTFGTHMKFFPIILLGYFISIGVYFLQAKIFF